jgi:16S rRNA (cytidine1402-2'-O)-methyltransferase
MVETGTLYIVATPIGNLEDITLRAQRILHQVDTIVAEDTRHTTHLLKHFGITRPLLAYHAHNEDEKTATLIHLLQQGKDIALVSDAGTPLISDPGFPLVHAAQAANITVVPIPGACALITALSVSGLSPIPFYFAGFLSPKQGPRIAQLEALKPLTATLVFYEAPHRLLDSLQAMALVFGNRQACLARELTKQFETVIRLPLPDLINRVESDPNQQKGESVVLIEGSQAAIASSDTDRFLTILLRELPLKQAVNICVELTGEPKNKVYEKALTMKG